MEGTVGHRPEHLEEGAELRQPLLQTPIKFLEESLKEGLEEPEAAIYERSLKLLRFMGDLDPQQYGVVVHKGWVMAAGRFGYDDDPGKMPSVGLKIHIALDWEDEFFLNAVEEVAKICSEENGEGRVTNFKVFLPTSQARLPETDSQKLKTLVVYPNYFLEGSAHGGTNVPEVARLVKAIRAVTERYTDLNERSIRNELNVGPGVFLRPGAFTRRGFRFESGDFSQSFLQQLEGMGLVEPDEFKRELTRVGFV